MNRTCRCADDFDWLFLSLFLRSQLPLLSFIIMTLKQVRVCNIFSRIETDSDLFAVSIPFPMSVWSRKLTFAQSYPTPFSAGARIPGLSLQLLLCIIDLDIQHKTHFYSYDERRLNTFTPSYSFLYSPLPPLLTFGPRNRLGRSLGQDTPLLIRPIISRILTHL